MLKELETEPRSRPVSRSEACVVALLVCLFTGGYSLIALFRHWRFETSYDLGIFDQAVWHLSRFERPASSISGFANILGDHFSPILALFAPLYWVVSAPEMLLVAQAFLFASSIVPVFLFLQRRLCRGPALAFSIAYGLFWGLQRAVASDVHEMAFAPVIIATAIYAMDQRKWPVFWIASLLLMLVKEDLIPILTFAGLYLIGRGERLRGAVLTALSLVAFFTIVRFVIPALNDSGGYGYSGSYAALIERPWIIPATLVTPPVKVETALMWLAPFCFLPLRSPLSVLLIPLALERFLSASQNHWGTSFHYSAPLAPIIAMSAGDGLARITRQMNTTAAARRRFVACVAGATVLLSSLLPGHLHLWRLLSPTHYQKTVFERTGYRALERIPGDATVVAQTAIVPHLSQRQRVYLLDSNAPDAEFLIVGSDLSPWPAQTYAELSAIVESRRRRGYAVIFDENGWIVLRQTGPGARTPEGNPTPVDPPL